MNFRTEIEKIFSRSYRRALFYNFPGGLRFELSDGGSPLDQALTALRKATVICNDVFGGAEKILVHLSTFVSVSGFELRKKLYELRIAGIDVPKERAVWLISNDATEDNGYWLSCAFEVPASKLQNLLWCAVTADFGTSLRPNPCCKLYLLNLSKRMIVHPYDDRGMDVVGTDRLALAELYERHNCLLLDFDIDAMHETFAHP